MTSNITDTEIWVPILRSQALQIVGQMLASDVPGMSFVKLLLALDGQDRATMDDLIKDPEFNDRHISRSTVVSLLVLAAFHGRAELQVTTLANDLNLSQTTTTRYLKTFVAVGILEQNQSTRGYRVARRWQAKIDRDSDGTGEGTLKS
jgi:hypothetical protein